MKLLLFKLSCLITLFSVAISVNAQSGSASIYDQISASPQHTFFTKIIDNSEFKSDLQSESSLTVFAPSDKSFELMSESLKDSILNDTSFLKKVLYRHIHDTEVLESKLFNQMVLNTLAGTKIQIRTVGDEMFAKTKEGKLLTTAKITSINKASNGTLLVINDAFIPTKPSLDDSINAFMAPITAALGKVIFAEVTLFGKNIPFVLIWLVFGSLVFTFYFKFLNFRKFKHSLDVVRGKFDDPNDPGEVSHFQALTAALSGTVGIGNIAGVAVALSLGGPGATLWMILAGLVGMSAKFVECTLGLKYRKTNPDGSVSGGPMHYLSKGLAAKGFALPGKILAAIFAVACIGGSFGGGNMVQINQATQQLVEITGKEASIFYNNGWLFGTVMAILVGIVIIGGIKSIAKVTDKIVPIMVGVYVLAALVIIGANIDKVGWAFRQIFNGAFNPDAMYGGVVGVIILGFRRAAFSNEAGIGSASIAHSAAKTDEPVSEGIVALLEPFIDTVIICTMTALVIIFADYGSFTAEQALYNATSKNLDGILITSSAFEQTISWFPYVLGVAVILFALSTMISWSYYGLKSWTYLFGESKKSQNVYRVIFCLFIIVGSSISAQQVFDFGDTMIFAMAFPNILGLYFLMPEVRRDVKDYFARIKSGEIKRFK